MSVDERSAQGAPLGAPLGAAPAALHPRSFKLRFAAQREPGRSYVSAVKPLGLPAVVRDAAQRREAADAALERRALRRVRELFARGPAQRHAAPVTTSHEYGWWWWRAADAARGDRRLHHHIRDSPWLKERLRILATDTGLKRR